MVSDDKMRSQAETYQWVDGFKGGPLSGPGRWVRFADGTFLYTDDDNILFARNDTTTSGLLRLVLAISDIYETGETAAAGFDMLKGNQTVVSGDLSEIPVSR
ncbi:hypothetical protein GONAM_15_01220 [Gordonia namibiensis NBRC 108229]|uniref:Uncharacterized protein n=1 Tax=Gordonia namibiensis NBRC 108229 TaxID=1208314 RepID=K6X7R7_9ACTN|nr:hypothetical protein [Gordonia namibiensis]GAC00413.1 hypothetical protein GONAM_15_01220 [Gordonia namibiensis NBRC 108229]